MALIGNHYRQGASPATNQLGSTNVGSMDRQHAYLPGRVRGFYVGQACGPDVAVQSFPAGYGPPGSWHLSPKAGGISSGNSAGLSVESAALLVGGITTTGTASFVIDFATATGGLIASGDGAASFTFTLAGELFGVLQGTGSASFTVDTNAPTLGAEASMIGTAAWALTAAATILPSDDTPPARTAAASFAITGTLLPYAIGSMTGSTLVSETLTADAVAAATLAALQATTIPVDLQRVRGQALDGTGTSVDPWGPA